MNLRQLELFTMVAETRKVSEAARQLYMTQPAVSQTITEMEENLGLKLFDRMNRSMQLTFAGEVLYKYSKRILSMLEEANSQMRDIANMRVGKLRMGASTTIGIYLLPRILGQFKKEFETVQTNVVIDNTAVIEEMILENQVDIGFVEGLVHSREILIQKVMDDELWLICSPDHRWAKEGREVIEPGELACEQLIVREAGSGTREVLEKTLQKQKIEYSPWHILNNTEAIKRSVMANIGIAFVSQRAVQDEIRDGRLIKVEVQSVPISREFCLIWHKDKHHSPLMDAFIQFVIEFPQAS